MNVKKFKEIFSAFIEGWKVRRIIRFLKTLPEIREAIDFIHLRMDIRNYDSSDLFSQKIIQQYPEKVKLFTSKFYDLYNNSVWIKKPEEVKKITKKKFVKPTEKSKINKVSSILNNHS